MRKLNYFTWGLREKGRAELRDRRQMPTAGLDYRADGSLGVTLPSAQLLSRLGRHMFTRCWLAWLKLNLILLCIVGLSGTVGAKPTQTPIQLQDSCITSECHQDMKQAKFLHGPLNVDQCEPCHITVGDRHEFQKPVEGTALCLTCHETEAPKKVVHSPFSVECTMCHNPHGLDNRYFLIGGTGPEGCQRCHTDVREGLAVLHGPVAQGECLACHTPHQSDHEKLLTDPPLDLCMACHLEFQAKLEGAISIHSPVKTDCGGCHGAHGGNDQFLLLAQGYTLCQRCHEDFLNQIAQLKFPHMSMTEGATCEKCHSPHVSTQEGLLRESNEDLCLSCHNEPIQTEKHTLSNMAAQIENATSLHGPLRQKNCLACHQAHGSDFASILNKPFPAHFYAAFEEKAYDLCFECHDKKLVLASQSVDTGFRNGTQNLHYLHVNREKGRSCRACHHEHASTQPNHIRSEVPFGRWTMRIEYNKTETGGGCITGCHLPYQYDREQSVQNTAKASP